MGAGHNGLRDAALTAVAAIVVVGLFLLFLLYVGMSRYYNAQELESLVEGARASGKSYSVVIHNGLTGRYSFNVE